MILWRAGAVIITTKATSGAGLETPDRSGITLTGLFGPLNGLIGGLGTFKMFLKTV